ncbi:glycosyltransferase family 2 protein [Desulfofustis glycolicus]|uniref:Glycosyltransferase involved in cell wall bisynthesis n=1 Tax=Desulfofustis glycolicus DSM 9705 TaxID=1121409 RepID=A0A1M5WI89_9BACT|nr:glycosyltransferase family 2 protein [Desulfofustis glycolicus]MCB2216839.1 glycosyltransferase family 2 protein [Desulfobulbaceae bacterium]SHH87196.1 Glycosyltransferase involved in cell wall bisynthesis [Desulfofustis glycolicus DSM 9705]
MKLIIQIPCYNEEKTLPIVLQGLPRHVEGFTSVEWLLIDDGCTDNTVRVAREHGVDHFVHFRKNRGLAKGFIAGLDQCLKLGADVIVNTDADNQYKSEDIPKLVKPILEGHADIVVGSRPIDEIEHFSLVKKVLQKVGSRIVRIVSNTKVKDTTSGFRAMSRDAAMRMNVFNEYTYTLETVIQAGQKNLAIISIPIGTNDYLRPSRLMSSIPSYLRKSVATIVRIFVVYKSFRFFMSIGVVVFMLGVLIGLRFLFHLLSGNGDGHIQSLILASVLLGAGFQVILVAFISDLLSVNRRLLEDIQYRLKKLEQRRR